MFLNDYIWEEFVKHQEFFLPGEGENFSSWKNYFTYLIKLKNNIKVTSNKKGYKMIPYRGHKAIITALNYIILDNELTKIIVSGDQNGIINTWKIDEDGDYEPDRINDTKSEIIDIKIYDNIMILWNKNSNFYIYKIDLNSQNININNNSQRFNLIYQHNITIENIDIKYIDWINEEDTIICSVDLNNKNNLKDGGLILCHNFGSDKNTSFHLSNDFDQLKGRVNFIEKKFKTAERGSKLISFKSMDNTPEEDMQYLKLQIKDLQTKNDELLKERDNMKKEIEELQVKMKDLNIFEILQDSKLDQGNMDVTRRD